MKIKCMICRKEVNRRPSMVIRSKHHFCSQKCYFIWGRKGQSNITKCGCCGKKIIRRPADIKVSKNHFCNKGCCLKVNYQN